MVDLPIEAYEQALLHAGYRKNSAGRWEDPKIGEDGVRDPRQLCEMEGIAPFNTYALDVEIRTTMRVVARDAASARAMVDALQGNEANFGAWWPSGDPVLGEIRITGRGICEQNGKPTINGSAR